MSHTKAHSFLCASPSYLIANNCLIEVLIGVDCLQRPNNYKQFVCWKAKSQGLNCWVQLATQIFHFLAPTVKNLNDKLTITKPLVSVLTWSFIVLKSHTEQTTSLASSVSHRRNLNFQKVSWGAPRAMKNQHFLKKLVPCIRKYLKGHFGAFL